MNKHRIINYNTCSLEFWSTYIATKKHIHHISANSKKLDTKHLYKLGATDDLPSGIIPLAVDQKIDHKYP